MEIRENNFDFLRLVFASFVIITHSYPLSGVKECDILCQISNSQISLSYLGVKGFFVISGYLIFQSLQRSKSLLDYFWKRLLRLFPALFIVLFLTVCLAPFVYQSTIPYFQNKSVLSYLPNNLKLYEPQYEIDGVFGDNPFKSKINGSLWTIQYEFTMYVLLAFLIFFRKQVIKTRIILLATFLVLLICNIFFFEKLKYYGFILGGKYLMDLGIFFVSGSLLASFNIEKIQDGKKWLILITLLVIASLCFGFYNYSKYITLPILFLLLGINPFPFISQIGKKIGDLSYGIYIYGFPIQQALMHYFQLNYLSLMVYSMVLSYILAYFSWHIVEKNALKFKSLL